MISDIRYGFRQLLKYPGFTAVAALTLALGVGVNTTMFSVLNAFVLQNSPARDSASLVAVFRTAPQSKQWPHAPANFYDYQRQATSYASLAAYSWMNYNLANPGQPAERLAGMSVSGEFFSLYGLPTELGRAVVPDDDKPGAAPVAVISDGLWRSHFASDPGIVGREVRLDGALVTVVGVMPARMDDPLYWGHIDIWRPLRLDAATRQNRDNNWMQALGRLKPGVSIAQAQLEATAIAGRLGKDFPATNAQNGLRLVSWNYLRVGDVSRTMGWLCMALAGFVLMIACANLANLQLARMASRLKEHAVRIALGATRLQLIRQLIIESLLLSILGGALGTLLAMWATKLIGDEVFIGTVQGIDLPVNTPVLCFTLIASVLTGIAVGIVPAWIASRTDVNEALKQGTRGSTGGRSRRLFRQGLIVAELALALVLLAGAGFFVRGMQRLATADAGWRPDGLVTASLSLPFSPKYATDAECQAFYDKLALRMSELPGAQQATLSVSLPIEGFWRSGNIVVEGRAAPQKGKEPLTYYNSVIPGHFSTVGIRLLQGRDFSDADRAGSHAVAIVNESMAKDLWPGESALGKRLRDPDADKDSWLDVVGVVNDVHPTLELFRHSDTPFQLYLPIAQTPSQFTHWLSLAVRSSVPRATVAAALKAAVQQIDPDQPVYAIATARESMAQVTNGLTLVSQILEVFALIGLILSAVGIYGVIAHLVAQRTNEIGIRMALGAQANDVLWMVLGQGMRLAVTGTAIGLACAWALVRVINSLIPAVHGSDPLAVALVASVLVAVALVACWFPARRATHVNPVVALRGD